jgi:hypothetical protein
MLGSGRAGFYNASSRTAVNTLDKKRSGESCALNKTIFKRYHPLEVFAGLATRQYNKNQGAMVCPRFRCLM